MKLFRNLLKMAMVVAVALVVGKIDANAADITIYGDTSEVGINDVFTEYDYNSAYYYDSTSYFTLDIVSEDSVYWAEYYANNGVKLSENGNGFAWVLQYVGSVSTPYGPCKFYRGINCYSDGYSSSYMYGVVNINNYDRIDVYFALNNGYQYCNTISSSAKETLVANISTLYGNTFGRYPSAYYAKLIDSMNAAFAR